jgi:hypothetical protein
MVVLVLSDEALDVRKYSALKTWVQCYASGVGIRPDGPCMEFDDAYSASYGCGQAPQL